MLTVDEYSQCIDSVVFPVRCFYQHLGAYLGAVMSTSVIVTGASGLLGRALCKELKNNAPSWVVQALAWSRAAGDLLKVDITCRTSVHELFQRFKVCDLVLCRFYVVE